ncbi:MAG TPA: DUF255 domain-containing protein [Candidatus Kapabacteria bacterium]|nr:DUF255 domain-containing protein [Candidatus Kapabacteria bacterium]
MKPIVSIIVVLMASVGVGLGQSDAVGRGQVRWVSFSEAVELSKKEPRKILIDIYTDWCGWCKKMDATTYGDGAVVEYINRHFYAVKYDAESKDSLVFNGHTFRYLKDYRCNEFAYSLLSGKMSYPSTVFLDEQFTMLTAVAGYLTSDVLLGILRYYGGNHHTTLKWEEYNSLPKQKID